MKVIHIADLHLGGTYQEKAAASIDFMLAEMEYPESAAYNPDLLVCTGDTTDKPLHVHSEALKPLLKLIQTVQCPMVFLQGTPSHEPYGFLQNLKQATGGKIILIDEPSVLRDVLGGQIIIAGLPALSRALLDKWVIQLKIDGVAGDTPAENIRECMLQFRREWEGQNVPKLLLGHWTVTGCESSTGHVLYGNDIAVSLEDLALSGAHAVLLGHIHKAQEWGQFSDAAQTEQLITYSGSTHPCNWGELDQKSFSVIEIEHQNILSFIRVPFPHKPMVKVELEFSGNQTEHFFGEWEFFCDSWLPETWKDAEVKCCYSIPREIAASVDDLIVWMIFKNEGIDLACVERTIQATSLERIPDIMTKETTRQQYEAVCKAKGEDMRPGACEKADEIDTGVQS